MAEELISAKFHHVAALGLTRGMRRQREANAGS